MSVSPEILQFLHAYRWVEQLSMFYIDVNSHKKNKKGIFEKQIEILLEVALTTSVP
jgi:hypothetical protein